MRPTQVYKWNWNRKRARLDLADGSTSKLKGIVLAAQKERGEADSELDNDDEHNMSDFDVIAEEEDKEEKNGDEGPLS